jgi:hypothetical protein
MKERETKKAREKPSRARVRPKNGQLRQVNGRVMGLSKQKPKGKKNWFAPAAFKMS